MVMFEYDKIDAERVLLVGLARGSAKRADTESSLEELAQLAFSAGAEVVGQRVQVRSKPDPAFLVGRGLVSELKEMLEQLGGNCVVFDETLSPAQQRNLEKALEAKVLDRAILILDIFAARALTAAARLQVELAQLEYTLPRLTGAWVHFSRQYGGIGAKGPGETQLEIDRRQVRTKIATLRKRLDKLDRQRQTQRKRRQMLFKVALVGYTNAGKSTLFNRLTRASVTTADRLFTTLDSTTRVMSSGYPCRIVFSDTVGFIKKLPYQLVESFKSTLEEVKLADLLLHVVDCYDPDWPVQVQQTKQVLTEIGADHVPYLLIYNKIDLNPDFSEISGNGSEEFVISAVAGNGMSALQAEIIVRSGRFLNHRSHN
jgi:GTP-binding protein HflX